MALRITMIHVSNKYILNIIDKPKFRSSLTGIAERVMYCFITRLVPLCVWVAPAH